MQLNSAVCPNCGGNLQLDPSMGRGYCLHCGSNIIIEDGVQRQKIELSGKVEVDGIVTVNSSLMRANQLFDSGDYDNAVKAFKKVLEADPSSHEAWWGAYLCEMAFAEYYRKLYNESRSGAKWADTIIENLNTYAYRAIEYAPQETKLRYQAAIKEDEEFAQKYQSRKSGKQKNGCYIATAVYGSYYAPQVIVLRRFRDTILVKSITGRTFIKIYYFLSPGIAKHLGNAKLLNSWLRNILDRFIDRILIFESDKRA